MYVLFIKTLCYLLIHIIVSSKFFGNPELIFSFHIVGNKEELKTKLKDIPREKSDALNSEQTEEDKVRSERSY